MLFEELDFIYMPSADVAADVRHFTDVLGARVAFAVEGMGTRVAMVELTDQPPRILLAGHLHGERPVLVYRVADLEHAMSQLEARGWQRGHSSRSRTARYAPSRRPVAIDLLFTS